MEFRLLGSVEALEGGRVVPLGGAKQRALLAYLLLHANEVVSTDRLIDALWGEDAPQTASNTVQVYISQLRKALGDARAALVTRSPGYVLELAPGQLDLARFRSLAAEAREQDEPQRAARLLREALDLWRGEALGDLAFEPFVQAEAERLSEERLAAVEDRVDAELALGRHDDVIAELESLVAGQPLRERPRAQLMLALYRAGRQADALDLYQRTRALLVDELGIEPGPVLQRLERAILQHDPELDSPPRPARTVAAAELPAPATPLVGRARELEGAAALLRRRDVRLVTLTGPGGIGKSRLALELARVVGGDFPDGVYLVELAPIVDAQLVVPTIAAVLGAPDAVAEHVRDRRVLILLDNFEQVTDASPQIAELLAAAPSLKVLATSRAPLHISGEHEFPVPTLADADAAALFTERSLAVKPSFEPTAAVEEICRRLDGLPLAIELAAARSRVLAPDALLARLERRLPMLTGGARDLPARQQTLRAAIEWSHDLLDPPEQELFARLGVFVGGFDLEAVEAVCDATLDGLESLVDKSLVREREGRFSMLETIREFAAERLDEAPFAEDGRMAHSAHFTALAEAADKELRGPSQHEWLDRLEADHDNLRAASAHAIDADPALALRFATALRLFWLIHGPADEGRRVLETVLAVAGNEPRELRMIAVNGLGTLAGIQGDVEAAERAFEEALALARELGDIKQVGGTLSNLGNIALFRGDVERAKDLYGQAKERALEAGNMRNAAMAAENLGRLALLAHDDEAAEALLDESVRLAEEVGDRRQLAAGQRALARLAFRRGDALTGTRLLRQCLETTRALRDAPGLVDWLEGAAAADSDLARAASLVAAADAVRKAEGFSQGPEQRTWYDETVARIRGTLGAEGYEAAYEAGFGVDLDAAFDLASITVANLSD